MGITKTKTLRKQFTIFLVKELLFIIVTILSSLILYFSLIAVGWVILPNNAEYVVVTLSQFFRVTNVEF